METGDFDNGGPVRPVRKQTCRRLRPRRCSLLRPDWGDDLGEGHDRQAPRRGGADRREDRSLVWGRLHPRGERSLGFCFFIFIFNPPGGWVKIKLKFITLPHTDIKLHFVCQFNSVVVHNVVAVPYRWS